MGRQRGVGIPAFVVLKHAHMERFLHTEREAYACELEIGSGLASSHASLLCTYCAIRARLSTMNNRSAAHSRHGGGELLWSEVAIAEELTIED